MILCANSQFSQYVLIFLGAYPDGLHEVDVQILNNQVCSDLYGPMITETMMCTSGSNGRGSCYGDSGGPGINIYEVVCSTDRNS